MKKNYIFEYYQKIEDGSICAGRWIKLFYEYIIKGLENKTFEFDKKKATHVIEWIESHCYHTEGPLAPNPFKLELWQKAVLSVIYGIVDNKGKRQFREIVLIMARKNGKSLFASAIAKYEWQEGGYGSRVYCLAPKLDQTDIIYNSIWMQTTLEPEYQKLKAEVQAGIKYHERKSVDDSELPKHRMTDLYIAAINSTVKKIAFSERKSDGFNPSLTICDEIASWSGDKGLKMYEVMKSGMGAREMGENPSLLLSCSTAGYVNDSIYDEIIKRSTRFLLGDSKETKLAPFLYMIDDIDKWNDLNELQKSNPNLQVSVSIDYLLEEIAIAEGSLSKKAEFITKYCCLKQNSSLAWLDTTTVNKCFGDPLDLEDFRSSYCCMGIDLSQTTDLTAGVCVIEKNGELYVFAKFWLPSQKIDEAIARDGVPYNIYIQRGLIAESGENFVDYHDCYQWLVDLVEKYEILPLKVGYDRYSAQYLIQDLEQYGFQTDDVFQGDNLWGVLQEMEGLMKDGKVHCGDNDLLKIHLLNSAIKMNAERGRGKLIKLNPSAHIDGCAALADAFCVRQKWYSEIGDRLSNEV
ncbi:MAG: terminase large subunit [Clostridiales bacterium]|nr:terminase large subunit [Clostridiales bacterium]MBQ1298190.1 terminase large subunit [Clostridiales bacterium]